VLPLGAAGPWQLSVAADPPAAPSRLEHLESADDRALAAAFLAGQREAFDVIVKRHQRHVYQLCYRFVGNHEDAADLTQDVFVRAFKGLKHFKGDSALGTWLYRVGVNACLNRLSLKRPQMEPVDAAPRVDERVEDPLDRLVRGEQAERVRAAVQQLPPKQRAALILRVYQELPHAEIAEIVGSSVGAVKANVFHALGNLKRLLAR
jgi:RNA polymerase sigma-70 factor (ECF subfamily)